jgi:cytochrome c-type biogenesis protein CcmH
MKVRNLRVIAVYLLLFFSLPVLAQEARPLAEDPVAEKRLLGIAEELRCLVCQNETIAASNAELAKDLRQEIRTMIGAGRSDTEIIEFMTERYGDFVLYRPPFKATTLLLWLLPPFFLLAGLVGVRLYLVRRNRILAAAVPVSAEDLRAAQELLADEPPRESDSPPQSTSS